MMINMPMMIKPESKKPMAKKPVPKNTTKPVMRKQARAKLTQTK